MAENLTAEQVREDCIRTMGPELGDLYCDLYNELAWLHVKWQQYRELFGKDASRIDLLNRAAPLFFGFLQKTLLEDVLLHLARLTDPPQSMGRDNLTVRRLPPLVADPALRAEVDGRLQSAMGSCEFARDWRNRRLAHADLSTSRQQHPMPLAPASRRSVEEALEGMRDLLNWFEQRYRSAEVAYEVATEPGGADLLVHYLEQGLKAADEEL